MKCIFRGVVLVAISVLFVLGCDPVGPSTDERSIDPPVEGLQVTPWEPGESLLPFEPPKRTQDGANSGATDKIRVGVPPSSDWDAAVRTESPYGCVMSTPAQNEPKRYWHEGVYLHFPATLTATATQTVDVSTTITSRTIYSDTPREEPVVARVAHCRIPDVARAREMVADFLHRFPPRADGSAASGDTAEGSTTWRGEPVSETRDSGFTDRLNASKGECAARTCTGFVCTGTTGNLSNCRWVDCECTELNTDSFGDEAYGGGGGALGGGSRERSRSSAYLSETLRNYGGFDTPGPGSCADCGSEEPADEPVSKAELTDLYGEECGYTRSDTMDKAFEVDVRYALGYSSAGGFEFPDGSKPDGVKRGVGVNNVPNFNYFQAMVEAKHKDRNLINSAGQTKKYIDELARPYAELPGFEAEWPPFLVIASLSTNSELHYLDDSGATLQHAAQKGVNVFHLTLKKDEGGQMYLTGRTIGRVTVGSSSDGSFYQTDPPHVDTESYEFEVLCKADEAESN